MHADMGSLHENYPRGPDPFTEANVTYILYTGTSLLPSGFFRTSGTCFLCIYVYEDLARPETCLWAMSEESSTEDCLVDQCRCTASEDQPPCYLHDIAGA